MKYQGVEGNLPEEMSWILSNIHNKAGADRDNMFPVALGGGINGWLNDRFGIGLQADYLLMPYKNVANSLQGTARLIWRVGGKSKKTQPVVQYVEVEKIVQGPPVVVEKRVEVPVKVTEDAPVEICELFNNIYFAFDRSEIRPESEETLNKIGAILKANTFKKYLITGYTDVWGNATYNIGLSRRRAAGVVQALEDRGVPADMLKSRGVGKKIAYAPLEASVDIREGDRKITVEIITNLDYWDYILKRDF